MTDAQDTAAERRARLDARMTELALLTDGWHGEGSLAVAPMAGMRAYLFGMEWAQHQTDLPMPAFFPRPDGEVQAEWCWGAWAVDLVFGARDGRDDGDMAMTFYGSCLEPRLDIEGEPFGDDDVAEALRWLRDGMPWGSKPGFLVADPDSENDRLSAANATLVHLNSWVPGKTTEADTVPEETIRHAWSLLGPLIHRTLPLRQPHLWSRTTDRSAVIRWGFDRWASVEAEVYPDGRIDVLVTNLLERDLGRWREFAAGESKQASLYLEEVLTRMLPSDNRVRLRRADGGACANGRQDPWLGAFVAQADALLNTWDEYRESFAGPRAHAATVQALRDLYAAGMPRPSYLDHAPDGLYLCWRRPNRSVALDYDNDGPDPTGAESAWGVSEWGQAEHRTFFCSDMPAERARVAVLLRAFLQDDSFDQVRNALDSEGIRTVGHRDECDTAGWVLQGPKTPADPANVCTEAVATVALAR